jgi:glycosyltransferase involved in cell wall biosynthesis
MLGRPVGLFCPWTDRLGRASVLHLFGMSREGLELARQAQAVGTPVVLSPICWFEPAALWHLEASLPRKIGALASWTSRRIVPILPSWRRNLLKLCARILPNSQSEAQQLKELFGVDPRRITVVPNGVQDGFRRSSPWLFRERYRIGDFVLFVGRVEPRKNTLGLIRAARSLRLPLVIVGDAPLAWSSYLKQCLDAGGDRVCWLGKLVHEDPLLASAYAAARVFALPSWFETPGLAALEAALAGAAVVITPLGSTQEYFGHRVEYCRPDRADEIASAILRSWSRGPNPGLADYVASNYLWPEVAKRTAEVYDQVAH